LAGRRGGGEGRDHLACGATAVVELLLHAGGVAAGGTVAEPRGQLRGAGFQIAAAGAGLACGVAGDAPGGLRIRVGKLDERPRTAPAGLLERRGRNEVDQQPVNKGVCPVRRDGELTSCLN
jgi:hypothetical protein